MNIIEMSASDPDGLLKEWHLQCEDMASKHTIHQKRYDKMGKLLVFMSIICSSTAGLSSFVGNSEIVQIVVCSLSLVSAILQSLSKYLRCESMETRHQNLASSYKNLSNDILYHLNTKNDKEKFIELVKFKMENYLKLSPSGIV